MSDEQENKTLASFKMLPKQMRDKRIVVLIRPASNIHNWQAVAAFNCLVETEDYWRKRIGGRGITAWSEYATPQEAENMLADPHYDNKTELAEVFPELPWGESGIKLEDARAFIEKSKGES